MMQAGEQTEEQQRAGVPCQGIHVSMHTFWAVRVVWTEVI